MSEWKEAKRVVSEDGKRRMRVMQTGHNLFRFAEDTLMRDVHPLNGPFTYWSPTYLSGVYDSAEAAERAARSELRWLRNENSD